MGQGAVGGLVKQEKVAGGVGLYNIKILFFFKCDYYIWYNTRNKRRCFQMQGFIYKILLKIIVMIISTKWSSLMLQEN